MKFNLTKANLTEIWFHSVIENNYVETTLATTFIFHSQIDSIKFTRIPSAPRGFKLEAESNKHRLQ